MQVQPFRCNSLLKRVSQPEIAKNSLNPFILGVKGHSTHIFKKSHDFAVAEICWMLDGPQRSATRRRATLK